MKRMLDRSRPFDIVCGGVYDCFQQDGRDFGPSGEEVGGEDFPDIEPVILEVTPTREPEPTVVEQDEDVKLESLHDKLRALGIKFHHRAGIPTLEKLLVAAELKKAERERI